MSVGMLLMVLGACAIGSFLGTALAVFLFRSRLSLVTRKPRAPYYPTPEKAQAYQAGGSSVPIPGHWIRP